MKPIIALLTHSCIDVLNLSLRGHGKNYAQTAGVDDSKYRINRGLKKYISPMVLQGKGVVRNKSLCSWSVSLWVGSWELLC